MKHKRLIMAGVCAIAVVFLMTIMFIISPIDDKIEPSSFHRKFRMLPPLVAKYKRNLSPGHYYLSGETKHTIYIGNTKTPFDIVSYPIPLVESNKIHIELINVDSITNPRNFITKVDSPIFYIMNGVMPEIFNGNINSPEASRFLSDKEHYFVDATPISKSSLALRSFSTYANMYQLAKRTNIDTPYFEIKHGILEKQLDGMIDVDGKILFDKIDKKLIYLYSYRNQYIVMDTNLNILYKANTIDTFKIANIKIQQIKSKKETVVASPPTNINNKSCVFSDTLYIQSNLLARNENLQRFQQESVIDKYDLKTGTYVESFYIPNYNDKRFIDFQINRDYITALYEDKIIIYEYLNKGKTINMKTNLDKEQQKRQKQNN